MVSPVLTFTVKADTAGAEGGVKRVGAAFNELGSVSGNMGKKLVDTDAQMERLAKRMGVQLSTAAQDTVDKLEKLKTHFGMVGAPAADMERISIALTKAQEKYNESLKTGAVAVEKQAGFWEQHGSAIATTAGAMGAAVLAFGVSSVKAFEESEIALAALNNVIRSTGGVAGVTAEDVLEMSAALQKTTGVSDEAATAAQTMLLSFTKIGKDVFPDVTQAVVDMATFMNKGAVPSMEQLTQTAQQVGKAMQDPVQGVSALQRVGVRLSDSQKELVKDLVAMGRTADAQRVILKELQIEFGGAGEAAGKTFRGQVKIAREEMNDFQETVGGKIVPVLQALMKDFPDAARGAILMGDSVGSLNLRAGELLIALPLMKQAFGGLGMANIASGFSAIGTSIGVMNPIVLAAAAAIGAFLVAYAKIAQETGVNQQLKESIDLFQKFIDMGKAAGLSSESLRTLKTAAGEAADKLGETRKEAEIFGDLVKKAASQGVKPLTGEIRLWATAQDKLNAAIDYTRPTIQQQIAALEKDIAVMKGGRAEIEEVWKAEDKLNALKKQLTGTIDKNADALNKLEKQYASTTGKIVLEINAIEKDLAAMAKSGMSADAMTEARTRLSQKTLELIASQSGHKEILDKTTVAFQENTVKALGNMTAIEQLEIAWKEYMDTLHAGARAMLAIPFDPMISNVDTLNEAVKRADEGAESWRKLNEMIRVETPEALKPAEQSFDEMGKQVSTVVTDLGKGIADALVKWEGFGKSMIKVAREFGSGILRTMIETWFKPLEGMLEKVATKLTDVLSGALNKMGGAIGGAFGKLFKPDTLLGGLATGGIMAGIGAGVTALVDRLGRRGREKTTATGAAEDFSAGFWEGTFKDVQAGSMSVDQGLAELNASWDKYVAFLNATLKDQTVIQRSIEGQRATLTEGTAALEAMRQTLDDQTQAAAVQKAVQNLEALGAQFMETGQMSEEFAKAVTDAGGSVEMFNQAAGQVQKLQGLRNELGALRQMVDSFLPKQKTWMENFIETGEITEDMAVKIRMAGGDINQFKKFAELKGVKTQFQDLVEEFEKTGIVSEDLLEMIKKYGDESTLSGLKDLMNQAEKSGKTLGDLAKDSDKSADIIQKAFESAGGGIEKAFGDAAKTLSDTLQKMDENLSAAIQSLQTAMVTMIKDLVDVLLGVPGAAEKAARDANFFLGAIRAPEIRLNVTTHFDDSGLRAAEDRARLLSEIGFTPQAGTKTAGAGVSSDGTRFDQEATGGRIPRFQSGTDYVPRTGLAIVHQGEAIIPAGENRGGNTYYVSIEKVVTDDPEAMMDGITRMADTNRNGARVKFLKALKLIEPGKF